MGFASVKMKGLHFEVVVSQVQGKLRTGSSVGLVVAVGPASEPCAFLCKAVRTDARTRWVSV